MSNSLKLFIAVLVLSCVGLAQDRAQQTAARGSARLQSHSASNADGARPRLALEDLFAHRSSRNPTSSPASAAPDALVQGMAKAKVYTFSTADYPGGSFSELFDTSSATSVGTFEFAAPGLTAFTVKNDLYQILTVPGSVSSSATAITTAGVIGLTYTDLSGVTHGAIDDAGTFTTVDVPGADSTELLDMNDAGVIVGDFYDSTYQGYVDNGGAFTTLDFPGAVASYATGINSAGDIVGYWFDGTTSHGFLLSGGVFTSLDFPLLAIATEAWGINDSGEISGGYQDATNADHGFVYSKGAWNSVDVGGASGTELMRIKNNGNVTGQFDDIYGEGHGIRGH